MATETDPDHLALRTGRRERLLTSMGEHDLDVLVLGRVANMRYATGVPLLWNAGTRPFGPGCVVVRETEELYLLSTWDEGVPEEIPHDHLYGITWNPMNLVELLKRIGAEVGPRRVGTDAMSPLFAQLLPMAFVDSEIVDASPALRDARRIKTADEVEAIRAAIDVAATGMAAAVAELCPGVTERELTGVFMDAMASRGVTTPATQDVVRVTSSRDADTGVTGAQIQPGDLVTFDAGVVAGGYAGEVGRTWPVEPDRSTDAVRDLYRRAERLGECLLAACQPGASGTALLEAYESVGEPLPVMPVGRGVGLGFDDPVIVRQLPRSAAQERLDTGVVLVVTACVDGDAGSVITRDTVLITDDGPEVLSSSPSWNAEATGAHR